MELRRSILLLARLKLGLTVWILCTRSSIQMMEKYSGATYRWTGVGALRAIWQEKLDVVNAQQGEKCRKTSVRQGTHGEVGLQRRKARNVRMISKSLSVRYEQPRPAERKAQCKTLCHYTDPGLKFVLCARKSKLYGQGSRVTLATRSESLGCESEQRGKRTAEQGAFAGSAGQSGMVVSKDTGFSGKVRRWC